MVKYLTAVLLMVLFLTSAAAQVYVDRVMQSTAITGTGTYSLSGTNVGYKTFVDGVGSGNQCPYCAVMGNDWEVGIGTVIDAATDTLSRDTILASTNGGAAVDWTGGTKTIFVTMPAAFGNVGFVTTSLSSAISNERLLTGSANEITVTDGGAGNNVTLSLPSGVNLGDASYLATDEVRAYDNAGLKLYEDEGSGIFVQDSTGFIGIGTTAPNTLLDVNTSSQGQGVIAGNMFIGVWNANSDYAVVSHKNFRTTNASTKYAFIQRDNGETYFNSPTVLHFNGNGNGKMNLYVSGGLAIGDIFDDTDPGADNVIIEGTVGIGTTASNSTMEINAATGGTLRLTYNDSNGSATDHADLATDSNGGLTVTTTDGDGAAGNITLTPDGNTVISIGNVTLTDGAVAAAPETVATLGVGVTTFAVDSNLCVITGDGGGNTVATITGGVTGQMLVLLFTDANITITDTDAHTANTVDLSAAFTSADDTTLTLVFDGTSWYETSRSAN